MAKNVCVVCGKSVKKPIKLPHGEVALCPNAFCKETFNHLVNDRSSPIMWAGLVDIGEHECAHPEAIKAYENDTDICITIANIISDYLWDGEIQGDLYHEALEEAGKKLELTYVENLKDEDLPLTDINNFKTEEAKLAFEKRLKGES